MDFDVAVDLVARRGRSMQAAAEQTPGSMVSLMGADEAVAEEICRTATEGSADILVPANFNCPGQIVLSGAVSACEKAAEIAADCGASGAVALNVAGAFHSPLMQPAADRLAEALEAAEIRKPAVTVLSNVTAEPHGEPDEIRRLLLDQLTQPVRWQGCCEAIVAREPQALLELGPGRVLAGLMRRLDRKRRVTSLNSKEAIDKYFNG
jgi:[acyl-carrier-protein] S-malonyltransferase